MNKENLIEKEKRIDEILKQFEPEKDNIISILHCIQNDQKFNYIPQAAIKAVADYVCVTPSEVYGVVSFYSMFSTTPRGKYIIRVCASAPCYVMGSTTVIDSLKRILGVKIGETTTDNLFTLEVSSCLGICDVAPAMMINDEVYGELTDAKIKEILERKSHE
ncbi:MAG: NADH-quinone oxidoreductase subunit NuoE [Candidatus Methanofastidiosia archaeon]|jgi:NADH-quinone oxidoreductase E subunit